MDILIRHMDILNDDHRLCIFMKRGHLMVGGEKSFFSHCSANRANHSCSPHKRRIFSKDLHLHMGGTAVRHLLKRMWIVLAVRWNYEVITRLESLEMWRITGSEKNVQRWGRKELVSGSGVWVSASGVVE